jgi:hypothetical protein
MKITVASGTAGSTIAEAVISIPITVHSLSRKSLDPHAAKAPIGTIQTSALATAASVCLLTSSRDIRRRSASTSVLSSTALYHIVPANISAQPISRIVLITEKHIWTVAIAAIAFVSVRPTVILLRLAYCKPRSRAQSPVSGSARPSTAMTGNSRGSLPDLGFDFDTPKPVPRKS